VPVIDMPLEMRDGAEAAVTAGVLAREGPLVVSQMMAGKLLVILDS